MKINKQAHLESCWKTNATNKGLNVIYNEVINKTINKFQGSFS